MAATDKLLLLEDGPYTRMIDSLAPTARQEGAYQLGLNVYPEDGDLGEAIVGRPGTRPMGAQLAAFPGFVQGIIQFPHSGVETTVAIAGGEIFTYNWTTAVWTKVVTTANLTTATATLSSVPQQLGLLVVTNKLLISDGTNTPILWDGASGAGGITVLTSCPALYGQPTLHQSRVFGIKASDPVTMVWSEADSPSTGYESGFTNAWTIRQTNPHALTRLVGTNQGLVVFRARSITMAVGDVGDDTFQSSDSQEAIDSTIGTRSPWSVVELGMNLVFLDSDLKPHLIRPGATGVIPIWQGFRTHLIGGTNRASDYWTFGVHYTPANLIIFAVADSAASTTVDTWLVLDARGETPVPVAIWDGWNAQSGTAMSALAMVLDTSDPSPVPRLVHGDYGDFGGYVYAHGNPDDATFLTNDLMVSGVQPVNHRVECQPLGYSVKREKVFDRLDVSLRGDTDQQVTLFARTPRGETDPYPVIAIPTDTDLEVHAVIGIDVTARWIAPVIVHSTLDEEFGLVAVTVTAYTMDDDPEVP